MSAAEQLEERKRLLTDLLEAAGELTPGEHVDSCDQLEGGWSRFSHVAVVRGADARERRYVVRVKAPHGLFDTDIVAEYNVFRGLQELELPIPRVFGLHETADNPFGGQLFVMEFLHGSAVNVWRARDHALLKEDWAGRRGIATDVVASAARIHSISPAQAPPGVPHISYAEQVERWNVMYREAGFNRDPVLEEAFWWLRDNAPAGGARGLVHGDFRIGNMLVDSGRVTAILDWELAYVGDVRFDLGYMATDYMSGKHLRPKTDLLGAVAEREWFFGEYERLTGARLDRDAVRAFSVVGLVALMAMTYKGLRRFADGRNRDFRRAWARFGLPGMRQELTELMEW
jgi:aminoglycoside phosphotransferase (APT) family kinase protein